MIHNSRISLNYFNRKSIDSESWTRSYTSFHSISSFYKWGIWGPESQEICPVSDNESRHSQNEKSGLWTHSLLVFPPNPTLTVQFLLPLSMSKLWGSEVVDTLSLFTPRILKRSHYSGSLFHSWSHKAKDDSYLTAEYGHLFSSQSPKLHSNIVVLSDCHSGTNGRTPG